MPNPASVPTNATAYEDVLTYVKELLPRNYIGGLITSNDADTDHDVNIAAGECRDSTDAASLRLATEITKQLDAAWAVGDDAGGIDAGAVAADTLYAVWLIKRSDTGVVDALFSTSFTAPTMPANYDYKRLIGAVMTEGAANILPYTQSGDYFGYKNIITDVNDATIADNVFETGTLSVPPSSLAYIYGYLANATSVSEADGSLFIITKGDTNVASDPEAFVHGRVAANFDGIGAKGTVLVDSSSQIEYAAHEAGGTATVQVNTIGFTMLTRREP
jgi:hypothetical protein